MLGLQVLDMSNPSAPVLRSTYPAGSGDACGVAVSGSTVFVANGNPGLQVLDVSNPSAPVLLSTYPAGSGFANDIAVSGSTVFVANGLGGLQVLDVSNSNAPILLSTYPPGSDGDAQGVAVVGSTIFVADFTVGLQVLDVSQGALMGTPPFTSIAGQQIPITLMAKDLVTEEVVSLSFKLTLDNYPYLPQTTVSDQSVFPGQTLSLPLSTHLFSSPTPLGLSLSLSLRGGGVKPSWLSLTPNLQLRSTYPAGSGNAYSVAVSVSTVFVADDVVGLQILDISNVSAPILRSTYSAGSGSARGVAVSGSTVFVADWNAGLKILDVSNPSAPILRSTYPAGSGFSNDVAVSGSTVFVADWNAGLKILDVSNPSAPILRSTYSAGSGNACGIAVSGSMLFIADDVGGLQVLDVSNLSAPILRSTYSAGSGNACGVAVSGSTVFVANGSPGLQVLDVSNPSTPVLLSTYPAGSGVANDVAVLGSTVFVADDWSGLQVLDVSNPSAPITQGIYLGGLGQARGIAVSGSTVFVADSNAGLQVLDMSQQTLTIAPSVTDVGNYKLQLVATDIYGGLVSAPFTVRVEGPPQMNGTIPFQYAKVGQTFNYFVPQGIFFDPNLDVISFSAQLESNQSAWLAFNGISAAFAGTPQDQDVGNFTIRLSATDNIAGSVNTHFGLLVSHLPVVKQAIPNQVAGINQTYQLTVPAATFFSQDNYPLFYSAQQSNGLALPGWLKFNGTSQQFSGQPNTTGTYSLVVVASDPYQGQVSAAFALVVEHFPTINPLVTLRPLLAGIGIPFNWPIPPKTFIDLDNNVLTYSAMQTNGGLSLPLPNWLSFNPLSLIFAGLPTLPVGTFTLRLQAGDPYGASAWQDFNLTVAYFPETSTTTTVPNQLLNIGVPYTFTIPSNLFTETDQAVLQYSARQAGNSSLPGWLSFNSTSLQLSGWPNITEAGQYTLEIVATNPVGANATADFFLIVEHFPQVGDLIPSRLADVNQPFSWTLSGNPFIDQDNQFLTYVARQSSGSGLPSWLSFNPQTLTFFGEPTPQPTDIAIFNLMLSATDPHGASAQQQFNLTVVHFPRVNNSIPSQLADIDHLYQYSLPSTTFVEDDNLVLLYDIRQSNGLALPSWLSFNEMSRQLSGWPNSTAKGQYGLVAIATNPVGANVTTTFPLIVEHFPQVGQSIPAQLADISQPFSFTLPDTSFFDPDGESLIYTTQQSSGMELPGWLTFYPQNRLYSGTPSNKDSLVLEVTATDPAGASATSNFTLQVIHFPVVGQPQSPVVVRAQVPFGFSVPATSFDDVDQVGLSYLTGPLPSWLTFNSQGLSFSGMASVNDIGTLTLTLIANDTRGASVDMDFKLVVRGNVPPVATQALSTQVATVGQAFSFVLPNGLFIDTYNNSLVFNATQQDGSLLPAWLNFDNHSLSFLGTPGHGDTNFYATRTIGIEVLAESEEGQAGTNFNIEVGGISWGQLAITISAPLISFFTTLYALYQARALFLNYCRKNQYTLLKENDPTAVIGQKFSYALTTPEEKIHHFRTALPVPESKGCCQFFKPAQRRLPGTEGLPWWLIYDPHSNTLHSKGALPQINCSALIVQAEDEAGVILEKFTINIVPQNQNIQEMDNKETDRAEVQGLDDHEEHQAFVHVIISN